MGAGTLYFAMAAGGVGSIRATSLIMEVCSISCRGGGGGTRHVLRVPGDEREHGKDTIGRMQGGVQRDGAANGEEVVDRDIGYVGSGWPNLHIPENA